MFDLKVLVIAKGRLADFNNMFDLAACNWDTSRPANELLCFISTACYINEFLIKDLDQAMGDQAAAQLPNGG